MTITIYKLSEPDDYTCRSLIEDKRFFTGLESGFREVKSYKAGGKLNEKFPGGAETQAEKLLAEGHTIEPGRGKQPPKVKDWESKLVEV